MTREEWNKGYSALHWSQWTTVAMLILQLFFAVFAAGAAWGKLNGIETRLQNLETLFYQHVNMERK